MLGEHLLGQLLAEVGAEAVLHDHHLAGGALQDAVGLGGVHVRSGVAGGGHDAAPVGVLAEQGGLEQGGAGDGPGHQLGVLLGGQAVGLHDHQMGGALAVGGDAAGHIHADHVQNLGEGGLVRLSLHGHAGGAVGQQEQGVVGAGVAVHGHHVEALVGAGLQHGLHHGGVDLGVGGDVGQHGGHVGVDHAGALGAGADADGAAGQLQLIGHFLLHQVGGHDGPGCVGALLHAHVGDDAAHALQHLLHGELLADDAGGAHEHLVLPQAQQLLRLGLHRLGVLDALLAGGGVGVAAVDDHGAGLALLQDLPVQNDGSGAEFIGGEHGRAGGGLFGVDDGHVGLLALAALHAHIAGACQESLGGGNAAALDQFISHTAYFLSAVWMMDQGYMGAIFRPVVSSRPKMMFMFWMAWPAAPLPMLSMTELTSRRLVRAS